MNDEELAEALTGATADVQAGETARVRRAALVAAAKKRGWTQQRIAAAAGVTQQAVAKILGKSA